MTSGPLVENPTHRLKKKTENNVYRKEIIGTWIVEE